MKQSATKGSKRRNENEHKEMRVQKHPRADFDTGQELADVSQREDKAPVIVDEENEEAISNQFMQEGYNIIAQHHTPQKQDPYQPKTKKRRIEDSAFKMFEFSTASMQPDFFSKKDLFDESWYIQVFEHNQKMRVVKSEYTCNDKIYETRDFDVLELQEMQFPENREVNDLIPVKCSIDKYKVGVNNNQNKAIIFGLVNIESQLLARNRQHTSTVKER
eukprot:TRINITY_DN29905_c0_g1_i1.p1 TRINITY_DN29905_c0_g1~~TRINITY_DN29905_c0_g1_i1.p1  ORF type:complete len:218 (+),score=34.21 TRINITY_DN29905_c0_g1_i1:79-732(+)